MVESSAGRAHRAGLELLAWAASLAEAVDAVHWGPDSPAVAAAVGAHGARRLLSAGDLGGALPGAPVAAALAARVAAGEGPDALLLTPTPDQRELAGRLSARLDRPVGAGLAGPHGPVEAPQLVLVPRRSRPGTAGAPGGPPAPVVALAPPPGGPPVPVARPGAAGGGGGGLAGAAVVVAGGRGLGSARGWALVEELARRLGGAPAATGAAVEAGWAPAAALVGQRGHAVAPEVYLGFGVSGAGQHLAGLRGDATVVAVDTDPASPLMCGADLAVVGDAAAVLARLVRALSSK